MNLINILFAIAAGFMLFCLYLVLSLRRQFAGGVVGRYWKYLTALVVLFTLGYLALPFFSLLPESALRLTVALVFLFGALYVFLTIKLINSIIKALSS